MTRKNRSRLQGFFGVLIGIAGYALFIYWKTRFSMCTTFARISLMVVVASLILYFVIGKRKRRSIISYFFSRIMDSFYLSRMLVAGLGLAACLALPISYRMQVNQIYTVGAETTHAEEVIINTFTDEYLADRLPKGSVFNEEDYQINKVYGDQYRLGLNIERIKPVINEEEWEALELSGKQDTIIAIIECEARYLGIPYKLCVKFSDDMDYETKGYYSHSERMICINNEGLRKDGGAAALVTALHEMRHCYQHAMCDAYVKLTPEERNLYCFYGVDEWCENINNYVDGEDNYYEYLGQTLEEDSRRYANKEALSYVREIRSLLNESEYTMQGNDEIDED